MPLTPEERERWRKYSADAHARSKANPKPCSNACGRNAAPRRKLCYACKNAKWREEHPEDHRSYTAKQRAKSKAEAIAAYGGSCVCCGESEPVFLSLDHVGGGGKQHRQEVFGQKGGNMWRWAKNNGYPSTLRLLCFNCNFAEHWGGCPHKKGSDK